MKQEGKFILFDIDEFSSWLASVEVTREIKLIQNHHTFIPSYGDFNGTNHFDLLRGMEAAHLKRGFEQIAQNITTFPDGAVAVCRTFEKAPAGIKGANQNGLCIENLGNFDLDKDAMTSEQRGSIIKLNALLCQRFSLSPSPDTVVFHHWYDLKTGERTNGTGTTKTCPGTNFFGGNTVGSSESNFIPLISESLADLSALTTDQITESASAGGN
jgi:hypothetical protein